MNNHLVSSECSGCGACYEICPNGVIAIETDEKGFLKAFKAESCISCGKCEDFCESRNQIKQGLDRYKTPKTYAAWSKDPIKGVSGNSGGLFVTFGEKWISDGGVVAAPVYDEDFIPRYVCADNKEVLWKQAWSKFVQSETGDVFCQIQQYINKGTPVLFVGAPCQVKGLYAYLSGDHPLLLTVQFPCIGMPQQWFYQEYLKRLANCSLNQISEVFGEVPASSGNRREMRIIRKDGMVFRDPAQKSIFVKAWNSFLLVDNVCGKCADNIAPISADLSWGNFWYIGEIERFRGNPLNNGRCSMLLLHSAKAERFLQEVGDLIFCQKRTYREAATGHAVFQRPMYRHILMRRYLHSVRRVQFQRDMQTRNYDELVEDYLSTEAKSGVSFWIARLMNKRVKAWIWRMICVFHEYF